MKTTNKAEAKFNVTDKLKNRALELLNESQAIQFAEGLRLNRAASVVFAREEKRLRQKYGTDDSRTLEMSARLEASETAKVDLFARYSDAMTPPTTTTEGWAVDGFVRSADGVPVGDLTVAPYDREGKPVKGLGSATTDQRGFFSIKVDKFPPDPPSEVSMRASRGRKILESKEVTLVPKAGASERVEIILRERFGPEKPPEQPTQPDKGTVTTAPQQPDKPAGTSTDKPTQPDKTSVPAGTTPSKPATTGVVFPPDKLPVIVAAVSKPSAVTAAAKPASTIKRAAKKTSASTARTSKGRATKATSAKAPSKSGSTAASKSRTTKAGSKAGSKKSTATKKKR